MLELYLFTTKDCHSSAIMTDRVFDVVKDKFLEQVRLRGKVVELNPRLCKELGVTDAPTLYCVETKEKLIGVYSVDYIKSWIRNQIIGNGNH